MVSASGLLYLQKKYYDWGTIWDPEIPTPQFYMTWLKKQPRELGKHP